MIQPFTRRVDTLRYGIKRIRRLCVVPLVLFLGLTDPALATSLPVCPNELTESYPQFAPVGMPPTVATWKGLSRLPDECHISVQNPAELTVAFASLFTHTGSIEEIAKRLGAISTTQGLPYWSVTDQGWRELVSEAYALKSKNAKSMRSDFTNQEILSARTLFFAQNDTRSWGLNTYSLRVISSSPDRLVVESRNTSPVRLGPITLFHPDDAKSVLFIDRMESRTWRYFSLSVIQSSPLPIREKSVINRQAAFYRLLIGQRPDDEPAVAP